MDVEAPLPPLEDAPIDDAGFAPPPMDDDDGFAPGGDDDDDGGAFQPPAEEEDLWVELDLAWGEAVLPRRAGGALLLAIQQVENGAGRL